jgi:hypothetical protein
MITGERKKFGLRPARKPALIEGLSNTVIVYLDGQAYYCYIAFSAEFPAAVGTQLPRGLARDDVTFLQVSVEAGKWIVRLCTLSTWERRTFWESATRPAWIKELKPIRHNHDTTEAHRAISTPRRAVQLAA